MQDKINSLSGNERLPFWWIFLLAPLGYVLTVIVFDVFNSDLKALQKLLGIQQGRMFSLLVYTACTGLVVLFYRSLLYTKGWNFSRAGYRNKMTRRAWIDVGLVYYLITFLAFQMISFVTGYLDVPMFWESVGDASIQQAGVQDILLGILAAVILAPLVEDTIFRGYVFEMLSERMNFWLAASASSLLFALLHIKFFGPGLAVWIFFFGLGSAWLYKRHDSIYPSLTYHALNNLWAYILAPIIFYS